MKKLLSVLLILTLVLSLNAGIGFAATESDVVSGTCGDGVTYTFDRTAGTLTIDGEGKITSTPWGSWSGTDKRATHTLMIGAGIQSDQRLESTIRAFELGIQEIIVDEGNPDLSSVDGVLFNKDQTVLLRYPAQKADLEYHIPDTVTALGNEAFPYPFGAIRKTEALYIPASVTSATESFFDDWSVGDSDSLKMFSVDEGSTYFASEDGVLFSKDMSELICYPDKSEIKEYTIPDSVKRIGSRSFSSATVQKVTLTDTVESIGERAFYPSRGLTDVYFSKTIPAFESDVFYNSEALLLHLPCSAGDINLLSKFTSFNIVTEHNYDDNGVCSWCNDGGSDPVVTPEPVATGSLTMDIPDIRYCNSGDEISVPIKIANNPGIVSLKLSLEYGEDLELIAIENGEILPDSSILNDAAECNTSKKILWTNSTASSDYATDGIIATLKFRVNAAAPESGNKDIALGCKVLEKDAINKEGDYVAFSSDTAVLRITSYKFGDITGDGEISLSDAAYLKRHIAEWTGYRVIPAGVGDLDLDGEVNLRDVMILEKYLAKWSGYETLPYIK